VDEHDYGSRTSDRVCWLRQRPDIEYCFRANDVRIYILPHVFSRNTRVSCLFVSLVTHANFALDHQVHAQQRYDQPLRESLHF